MLFLTVKFDATEQAMQMTKGEKVQLRAIEIVLAAGFVAAGETPTQSFRTGSASNPIYGGIGGKLCTVGGRSRFTKPGTSLRITVGKVTTCFYEVVNGETQYLANVPTRDEARVKFFATGQLAKGECEVQPTRANQGGLEPRFVIERADGKPIDPTRRYSMVLDFSGADPHALVAAKAYADSVRLVNPTLADDIETAIANPESAPSQHKYAA